MRFLCMNLFVLVACFAHAQDHFVTLPQSRQAALLHSNTIKNGELKINSAKADVTAAKSGSLPSVSGVAAGVYGFKDFIGAIPSYLPDGINNFYLAGVTGTESIYAGGRVKTGNKLATLQLEVNRILATQSEDSVLLLTDQKYWNIVGLQEQHKTLEANERLLDTVLKMQKDLLASGLIARNDMLKTKVQRSQLLLNKSRLENGRKVALLDFWLYTGLPYDSLMVMQDSFARYKMPVMPAQGPDTGLSNINSYRLLTKNIEGEKLQTKLTRGEYLPTFSAGVSALEAGVINKGIGSTFIPAASATLSVPISDGWWGKGKQKMKQRAFSEDIARNNLDEGSRQLKIGIMKSWYDLTDGLKQIGYAEENLEQAEENLKVNQDNYKAGLASISELLDAQASWQQAASDLVRSYADYQTAMASYYFITGRIKDKN